MHDRPTHRKVDEAAEWIRARWPERPQVGVVLGSGLGAVARQMKCQAVLPYDQIPHFPRSTAPGHRGQLVCGRLAGCPVAMMEGRPHAYEGYGTDQIVLPIHVLGRLAAELVILSNAGGGMNPRFRMGDIMVVHDHINLIGRGLPVGAGPMARDRLCGLVRAPYDEPLVRQALEVARRADVVLHRGVYVAVPGPNYETRAEYRFLRAIGGDVVGMSTAPEAEAAAQIGLRVLALSTITNVCLPDALRATSSAAVLATARAAEANLRKIVVGIVASLAIPV